MSPLSFCYGGLFCRGAGSACCIQKEASTSPLCSQSAALLHTGRSYWFTGLLLLLHVRDLLLSVVVASDVFFPQSSDFEDTQMFELCCILETNWFVKMKSLLR